MSERTKKIEAIFHAASERSTPEERESFLNEACRGDEGVRKEVDQLLKAALAGEGLFQGYEQSSRRSGGSEAEPLAEQPGTVIGRYKLQEKIGEGGMGVVYMAEQEQPIRRKVALKIIKLGMDTRQVVARFEAERQALAMMNHPHIAQVLDAGATDNGRPYFVMELVQGVPITQFCEANQLSITERLKLFIPVCQAIQSAHHKGIIHRDIKPSNVLVTMHNGAPHPMVIDFGVAKAIDQKLTEKTLFTNFATMIGTPAYMSPEQAEMSKLDVDTRSDIYSLGVVLYQLLTGTTPFPEERLRSAGYAEMQRIIAEEEPERPSTRLKKKLTGTSDLRSPEFEIDSDLEWIVMRCLEKDRNRRYETANSLAADIHALLRNEPVTARPPTAAYRFRKLVHRNRLTVGAVAAVAVALLAGLIVSSWQAVRARRAEQEARRQAALAKEQAKTAKEQSELAQQNLDAAEAVKAFLLENLLGVNACCGTPEPDAAAYAAALRLIEKVGRGIEGKFANQPQIEAEIRAALVDAFNAARDFTNMQVQAERLRELRERLVGPHHSDTLAAVGNLARAKHGAGQVREAEKLLQDTIAAIRNSTNAPSVGGAVVMATKGHLLRAEGRAASAVPYLREAVEFYRASNLTNGVAKQSMGALAMALQQAGQWDEAEALWTEALRRAEVDHGPDNPFTVQFQFGLARLLMERKRVAEASPLLQRVVALDQEKLGLNHFATLDARYWLGQAYEQQGEIERAAALYAEIHPQLANRLPYYSARYLCDEIAKFYVRHRRYEEASAVYGALRASFAAAPPENNTDLDRFVTATAATQGWLTAAEVCRTYAPRFERTATRCRTMAVILLYSGDVVGYQHVVDKVFALLSLAKTPKDKVDLVNTILLGTTEVAAGQRSQCESVIKSLESDLEAASSDEQNSSRRAIGGMLLRLGRLTDSLAQLERAQYPRGTNLARVLALKAIGLHGLGRIDDARAAFEQAETMVQPLLIHGLTEFEGFLNQSDRTYLIHRREVRALLARN